MNNSRRDKEAQVIKIIFDGLGFNLLCHSGKACFLLFIQKLWRQVQKQFLLLYQKVLQVDQRLDH